MKIVSTGRTISTTEYYEKKLRERRKKIAIALAIAALLIAAAAAVLRVEDFRISRVEVSGADVIGADKVVAAVEEIIGGNYLWIFPRDSFLLYPKKELKKALASRYPRFNSIDMVLEGTDTLALAVVEREPFALFCLPADAEASRDVYSEPCYFLDKTGFIFDQAPTFSEGVYLVYTSDIGEPLGKEALPQGEFVSVARLINGIEKLGLEPLSLAILPDHIRLLLANRSRILWLRESDPERVYSNLESFLKTPAIAEDEEFLDKLVELDLRIENKVHYSIK